MTVYLQPTAVFRVAQGGEFGGSRNHHGVDTVAAERTPVRAEIGGEFVDAGYDRKVHGHWGMWKGDDGNFWNKQHLAEPFVPRGRIEQGDYFCLSGDTGAIVRSAHLHTGVSKRPDLLLGTFDPMTLLAGAQTWAEFDTKEDTMFKFHRIATPGVAAQQIFVTGASQEPVLIGLTTNTAAVAVEVLLRRFDKSEFPPFTPAQDAEIRKWLDATALSGAGTGGAYIDANYVDDAEFAAAMAKLEKLLADLPTDDEVADAVLDAEAERLKN